MGLRIVDRQFQTRRDVTDAEHMAGLESEARRWSAMRPGRPAVDGQDFMTHFREVRARLCSADRMAEMAHKIRKDILGGRNNESALSHGQVDIATLLELL